jgi:hypothetical protein
MMKALFKSVQERGRTLKTAFAANQTAFEAYERAQTHHQDAHTVHTAHSLVNAEAAWDDTRDQVISAARALLDTAKLYLLAFQPDEFPTLRKQITYLREGFDQEMEAFKAYSSTFDDTAVAREGWEAAKGEIISRAWPLVQTVERTIMILGHSTVDTELDPQSHTAAR